MRSLWFATFAAVVLAVLTCAGVLLFRGAQILSDDAAPVARRLITPREQGWDFWSSEIDALAADLKRERQALDTRGKDLDALAKRLDAEKKELLKVRADVEAIRTELDQRVTVLAASEKVNLKTLSRTFSAMKPAEAVMILSEMDDVSIVKLLAMMKPDVVGPILAQMAATLHGSDSMAPRVARLSDRLRLLKQDAPQPTLTP